MALPFSATGWQPSAVQGASEYPGARRGMCTSWQAFRARLDPAPLGQPPGTSPQNCQAVHCRQHVQHRKYASSLFTPTRLHAICTPA